MSQLKSTYVKYVLLFVLIQMMANSQNMKFKHLSVDEGLSAVTVNTIFQDSHDFIWIGTQDGLNRYDGYHFKIFKNIPSNPKTIGSNNIRCIIEDSKGDLYIGTNGSGISLFNKNTETFTNFTSGLSINTISSNEVKDICELNDNELIVSTINGVNIFNKLTKKFTQIFYSQNQAETVFTKIFKDTKGQIWIGSEGNDVFELDVKTKELIRYELPEQFQEKDKSNIDVNLRRKNIYSITQFKNQLILGTDGGLLYFDINTKQYKSVFSFNEKNRYNNRVKCLSVSADSTILWFGTWGGLVKFNLQNQTYTIEQKNESTIYSISSNKIGCLLKDKQQNLWLGTEENGVNIFFNSLNKFPVFNSRNGIDNDFVYSIYQLTNQNILVGTENGLFNINPSTNEVSNYNHILKKHKINTVLSLLEDHDGNIWIGSYGQGIVIYNPKNKSTKNLLADKYLGGTVMKIIQSKNGVIWVATYKDGLYAINPNTYEIKRYTTNEGLPSNNIFCVYEDKNTNTLILGTDGGGVCFVDFINNTNKPFITSYKHNENRNSISSNSVNDIYKDNKGLYWFATSNGLNKFDLKTKQFTIYSEKDGLPNSYIYAVIPDKQNNLWLPSNSGLTRFNPNIKNENGSAFKNYNTNDGIQAREFNQGASFLCKDGKILVGGIAGLNYFDPLSIKENSTAPYSYIYSYSRQGNDIESDTSIIFKKHIKLTHKENYFTFELVALDYIDIEKNKFMYLLEGYDKNWSSPSKIRYVSYTELPGGDYTFKVKACNSDGVWNEQVTELHIQVIPPWWKTTWFYITAIILTTVLVFGFINYRTNTIKKENKILESKVAERTKELAEKNRDITSSIEYAKRIQEAILPAKELIYSKLKNVFILYKPKDIVSGDFYWFGEKDNYKIIAVVDCTGHGVPGAFMSMIGHNLLNQIVSEKGLSNPGQILEELHKGVQAALKQGHNNINTNDGMDISLLAINTDTRHCLWAGAFRNLMIINNEGELDKIDGNKYPIGGAQLETARTFTTHSRQLQKNDCLYMSSDGYADQFGGPKGKKFMVRRFQDLLCSIHLYSMQEQQKELDQQLMDWKGEREQIDDVLVIGIKV